MESAFCRTVLSQSGFLFLIINFYLKGVNTSISSSFIVDNKTYITKSNNTIGIKVLNVKREVSSKQAVDE